MITKKEGFWFSQYTSTLPNSIANELSSQEAKIISDKIKILEDNFCKKHIYKGISYSRLTGEMLGSDEFLTKDKLWCFPADFRTHYVLKHRVKPSKEFLEYLNNKIK